MKVELDHVDENGASFFIENNIYVLHLTPLELYQAKELFKRTLFAWHELTGKFIDEGNPT